MRNQNTFRGAGIGGDIHRRRWTRKQHMGSEIASSLFVEEVKQSGDREIQGRNLELFVVLFPTTLVPVTA